MSNDQTMQTMDEHDRRLLDHVQPAEWVNHELKQRYHLVIGAPAALTRPVVRVSDAC